MMNHHIRVLHGINHQRHAVGDGEGHQIDVRELLYAFRASRSCLVNVDVGSEDFNEALFIDSLQVQLRSLYVFLLGHPLPSDISESRTFFDQLKRESVCKEDVIPNLVEIMRYLRSSWSNRFVEWHDQLSHVRASSEAAVA